MTVEVSRKGEIEYLYLPCSIQDINHALSKLQAKTWGECECSLESSNFPAEDWSKNSKSILANEAVYCLNNTCEALQRLTLLIWWSIGGFMVNPQGEYNKRIDSYSRKRTIRQDQIPSYLG